MQKASTLKFWDNFYIKEQERDSNEKEWIVQPDQAILDTIKDHLPSDEKQNILEIGCGNSSFSLSLWEYLTSGNKGLRVTLNATDVSKICVEQNLLRDVNRIESVEISGSSFRYSVLDVLELNKSLAQKHAMILDKGCLDTFLFRSSQSKKESHSPLVRTLLDNIHEWLQDDGKYIFITPRSKLKSVRDYAGFSSVKRIILDTSGHLERKEKSGEHQFVFMYICSKSPKYNIGMSPFRSELTLPAGDDICKKCGMSFNDFLGAESVDGKGKKTWARRWRGHSVHCRGINEEAI
uniref:Methyltransferase domain-containing protein n=1 Tax=Chaetoceros debilis TaxID=122233 RepID=A0A7S3VGF0_9STRA